MSNSGDQFKVLNNHDTDTDTETLTGLNTVVEKLSSLHQKVKLADKYFDRCYSSYDEDGACLRIFVAANLFFIALFVFLAAFNVEPALSIVEWTKSSDIEANSLRMLTFIIGLLISSVVYSLGCVEVYRNSFKHKAGLESVIKEISKVEAVFLYKTVVDKQWKFSGDYSQGDTAKITIFLADLAEGRTAELEGAAAYSLLKEMLPNALEHYRDLRDGIQEKADIERAKELSASVFGKQPCNCKLEIANEK